MDKALVNGLIMAILAIVFVALIIYRLREHKRFKTILEILGKERDSIADIEYAKVNVAYGRKKRALLLLGNALIEDPSREDIRKAIRVIESW